MLTLLLLLALAFGGFATLLIVCISIVEAPWPVLLGMLVVGLLTIQWLTVQGRAIAQSPTSDMESLTASNKRSIVKQRKPHADRPEGAIDSSLSDQDRIYRGIHYQGHQPSEQPKPILTEQTIEGVYRGQQWHRDRQTISSPSASLPDITYRGKKVIRPSDEPD